MTAQSSWLAATPPSVAIELASRRVTVVEIARTAAGVQVGAYASEPVAADVIAPALTGSNIANPAAAADALRRDRKSTRLNSSHVSESRMPSSA